MSCEPGGCGCSHDHDSVEDDRVLPAQDAVPAGRGCCGGESGGAHGARAVNEELSCHTSAGRGAARATMR